MPNRSELVPIQIVSHDPFTRGLFSFNIKSDTNKFMSVLHHAEILENIFDEVVEAFPYLDEDKQIEIANKRFEDMCQ